MLEITSLRIKTSFWAYIWHTTEGQPMDSFGFSLLPTYIMEDINLIIIVPVLVSLGWPYKFLQTKWLRTRKKSLSQSSGSSESNIWVLAGLCSLMKTVEKTFCFFLGGFPQALTFHVMQMPVSASVVRWCSPQHLCHIGFKAFPMALWLHLS